MLINKDLHVFFLRQLVNFFHNILISNKSVNDKPKLRSTISCLRQWHLVRNIHRIAWKVSKFLFCIRNLYRQNYSKSLSYSRALARGWQVTEYLSVPREVTVTSYMLLFSRHATSIVCKWKTDVIDK